MAQGANTPSSSAATPEQAEGDEHRHGHHAGIVALIAMSIHDLDLSADQKAAVEKIRADLVAKMEPARAASQDLAGTLADGVAAGTVDRAKADAAVDKIVAQATALQSSSLDAMNQLHAALTPAQRATLASKLQEHFEKWKEANGHEDQEGQHRSGPMLALVKDLSLSQAEAEQIKASFRSLLKANATSNAQPGAQDHQHREVSDHLQAFATAFKADSFDAHSLTGANAASAHMAKWGATRMARFMEAAAPILTPDQRTKLAQLIRDRASRRPT
jgi:Spy/CpxP family protein refolding chaperone